MKTSLHFRKKLLASLVSTSVATIACAPAVSWSQTANATLRGSAPANTDITAKNIATGSTRRTRSAADGSYALVGLQPGTYQVDAGPGTGKVVTLSVASTATLNLAAGAATAPTGPATTLAGVTVTGTTLTEVKTSEVGSTISLHQINTIPQVSRNFLEFADTVPGMVFSVDNKGHTSLRGGAQNNSSVNVFIDGVGQKSYVKEGGVSGQFSSQGNPFPQLAIGEYKVITSNYKAEYDQALIGALVIPAQVAMLPLFLLLKYIGLVNSYAGVIVPAMATIFGIYLVRQYARGIPDELLEAARIDGAGEWRIFALIVLPLLKPIIATLAIFTFLAAWNDFMWPLIVLTGQEHYTLPLALASLAREHAQDSELMMAGSVVTVLPVLLLFLSLQRYYLQGLLLGSVKG